MKKILQIAIARLKEPSSMASIAVLLGALGWNLTDEMMAAVTGIVGGVAAIAGILMSEGKGNQ